MWRPNGGWGTRARRRMSGEGVIAEGGEARTCERNPAGYLARAPPGVQRLPGDPELGGERCQRRQTRIQPGGRDLVRGADSGGFDARIDGGGDE